MGDPLFPQLGMALNAELMSPLLSEALGGKLGLNGAMARWQLGEKRYKPGRSLLVTYHCLDAGEHGHGMAPVATGRLCTPGQAEVEYQRERARQTDGDHAGLSFLSKPAMVLWAFPCDRKLTHLLQLLNREFMRGYLGDLLPRTKAANGGQARTVDCEVLHYLPERSCIMRYRIEWIDDSSGRTESRSLYGKTYADDTGARTFGLMTQLTGQFAPGAQALAYDPAMRTLWQSHVPGEPVQWRALQGTEGTGLAEGLGACAALFHRCTVDTDLRLTAADVIQALLETARFAREIHSTAAPRIDAIVEQLLATRENCLVPSSAEGVVHQDLKLNNFLHEGVSLRLIDMDCVCRGDPMADLGSLIANLYLNGLREQSTPTQIHAVANALVRGYRETADSPIKLAALRWYASAALLHEVVRRSLRQLDPQRLEHLTAYLDISAHYADRATDLECHEFTLI